MFAKTAFLTGAAALMLSAAPALAQDAMSRAPAEQTAPTTGPTTTPATAPAAPGTLQIQPGSDVKGSDGALLGKLEGVHSVNGTQELKVRGSDGVLRGVPLSGLKPDGAGIAVAWTAPEFQASAAINEPAPTPAPAEASEPTTDEATDTPTSPTTPQG